jgi:predicted small lipoprotein YifL
LRDAAASIGHHKAVGWAAISTSRKILRHSTVEHSPVASRVSWRLPVWCGHVSEHLMSPSLAFSRALLVAGLITLSLAACGRPGALEAPPDPNAAPAQQGTDGTGVSQGALPSPVGTPSRTANRPITKPKTPFILDPLL